MAIEPDAGIITDCEVTKACGEHSGDAQVGPGLLAEEEAPVQVLGDSAYGSGQARADLAAAGHEAIIKPGPLRPAVPGGFSIEDFAVNADQDRGDLSQRRHVPRVAQTEGHIRCGLQGVPTAGPVHTTSLTGQTMKVHEHDALLRAARRQAETKAFQQVYRRHRPMVERSIAWLTRGNRKVRYRGVGKTITGCTYVSPR
ncbi:MAG: hypothetical protein ACR2P2_03050 [Nakamurella sp.]